ncbi:MAG: glycosyltransferase family 4 protein, partial [Acidobacteriota bacterium]|nr:glycosyltransferase family 4 protein [Acidobacteriota bacterium]
LLVAVRGAGCDTRALSLRALLGDGGQFDLVHAHDGRAHTIGLLSRRPLVVSRRVAFPPRRTPWSWLKYRRPAEFVAVSRYVENVLGEAGVPPFKISLVYDGVHVPDPGSLSGRVVALDSEDPGKGKAVLEQASRLAGIPIHFSRELQRDLRQASLFVYITKLEGLGSAALLAMSYGVPVLASDTGGLPEIVQAGVTGLLTGNEPAAIAERMRLIQQDQGLARRLGSNGRAAVERGFTVGQMVEGSVRAYEKVLR